MSHAAIGDSGVHSVNRDLFAGRAQARKIASRRNRQITWLGISLAPLLVASAVQAQTAEPSTQDAGSGVQEVVVTARHRAENSQKVPAALSVIGGDFLAKTNTTTVSQLVQLVPSIQFSYSNARNSNINIRGLGSNLGLANDGLNSGVGYYIDQVYYTRAGPTTFDLADISQIEVLRGPEGTLFGKDTTAGAIVINTALPTFKPSGLAEVSGGDYGYFQAKATVSGPLIPDVLAGSLAFQTTTRDGFLTNAYNGKKVNSYKDTAYRGQLLYTPTNDLRVRFIADYNVQPIDCCAQVLAGIESPPNGKNFTAYAQHFGYTPVVGQVAMNSPFSTRQETGGVSTEIDYSLPKLVFTSVTAWRFWNFWPVNDADLSPLPILLSAGGDDYENQFTQEFRVASAGVNVVDYVAGLYIYHEKLKSVAHTVYGADGSYFLLGPAANPADLTGVTANSVGTYDTSSAAAFAQAVWHVTSQLNLTGGVRYTQEVKRGDFSQTVFGGFVLTSPIDIATRKAVANPGAFGVKLDQGRPSGMVNVSYQLTPQALAYVNYSTGYKSGGLNLQQLPPGAKLVVQPETIQSVELGLKTQLFERKVTLNADLFWEQDKNYQANNFDQNLNKVYLSNIPEVRSQGIEADLQAHPTADLSFYASGTYDDATYANYPGSPCGLEAITTLECNLTGRPLAGVPRWAASVGGEFSQPLPLGALEVRAYVGADFSYRSAIYSQPTDSIYSLLPDRSLLNLRLGVRSDRWDAYIWSKNITDTRYYVTTGAGIGNTGALYGLLGDPQTWGVTLRYKL